MFLAILRDIKKDMESGKQPSEAVTAAMFQTMRNALAERKQIPFSIDDVTAMVAGQIGQLATMDEEAVDLFQQLAKKNDYANRENVTILSLLTNSYLTFSQVKLGRGGLLTAALRFFYI